MSKTVKRFEQLEIWQLAREFAKKIWFISIQDSFANDFALKNQINKSAGSTMDNIAEGHDRGGNNEYIHFLSIAKASNSEARSQLLRAFDRNHITREDCEKLYRLNIEIGVKTHKLIMTLKASKHNGPKFKK